MVPKFNTKRLSRRAQFRGIGCASLVFVIISLAVTGAISLFGFFAKQSTFPRNDSNGTSYMMKEVTTDSIAESLPEITYELVVSDPHDDQNQQPVKMLRYIAKEKRIDDVTGSTYQNVTVHRWMSLLTHPTNHHYANQEIDRFNKILVHAADTLQMKAFFFETKGVNYESSQRTAFEFVLIKSNYLYDFADNKQDADTFGEWLRCDRTDETGKAPAVGCVFPNLGGDSTLIAPTDRTKGNKDDVYGHLAAFVQRAPTEEQVIPFWKFTIQTVLDKLRQDQPQMKWFSTDGTGVRWLHMRIDPRPKYYDYEPFMGN